MSDEAKRHQLHQYLESTKYVMFATQSSDGRIINRPMTVQAMDGWRLQFLTEADNSVVSTSDGRGVNLSFTDGGAFVSVNGTGSVSRSVAEKRDLWDRLAEAHAGDPEDPDVVIVSVDIDEGEFWDHGNLVTRTLGAVKTALSGKPAAKANAHVDL